MKNYYSVRDNSFPLFFPDAPIVYRPLLFLLLLLVSLQAAAFQIEQKEEINIQRVEALTDSVAEKIIGSGEVPGMSVAVAKNGKILFLKNYGKSDLEMHSEVKNNTIFGLASITKQFTAATILRLVEQKEISLNDPMTKFLPEYPAQGNNVTIHHLLSHTSGMKDYEFRNDELPGWYSLELPYQKMIELWAKRPFNEKPGEKYDYNNWGYYLLGQIIERVTGTPWSRYAEPELLKPLGLENILFAHQVRIVDDRAKGYLHQDGAPINVPYRNIEVISAGGGLSSTIEDIVQWTHLLHSEKVVSKESLIRMTTPAVLSDGKTAGYGYGLYVNELRGHEKIYHGGTFGFGPFVSHYPKAKLTIAVLTNSTKGRERAEQLEGILAAEILNIEVKNLPLSENDLKRYSGVYSYQSTPTLVRKLKVFGDNKKLMAQIENNKPFLLRSQGDHKFIPASAGITDINFMVEKGKVTGLTIHEGAWEVTPAKKIGEDKTVQVRR